MYSVETPQEFIWTENGQHRVAAAIKHTLKFNKEQKLRPKWIREMSRLAGSDSHTSLGDYAAAKIGNPNRDDCRVLRSYAPFIYRVKSFRVRGYGIDRFVSVDLVEPDFKSGIPYWEQPGVTYANSWVDLLMLGTIAGDALEVRQDDLDRQTPAASLVLTQIKKMQPAAIDFIARGLELPVSVLMSVRGEQIDMDKSKFQNLGQVLQDFLVRTNETKTEQWDLTRLSNAIQIPDLGESRLKQLVQGTPPTEGECMFLSSIFKRYGVDWETQELLELGFANEPQQGNLLHSDPKPSQIKN